MLQNRCNADDGPTVSLKLLEFIKEVLSIFPIKACHDDDRTGKTKEFGLYPISEVVPRLEKYCGQLSPILIFEPWWSPWQDHLAFIKQGPKTDPIFAPVERRLTSPVRRPRDWLIRDSLINKFIAWGPMFMFVFHSFLVQLLPPIASGYFQYYMSKYLQILLILLWRFCKCNQESRGHLEKNFRGVQFLRVVSPAQNSRSVKMRRRMCRCGISEKMNLPWSWLVPRRHFTIFRLLFWGFGVWSTSLPSFSM